MADDGQQLSALLRRHQQLKRWEDSEANLTLECPRRSSKRVKFQDGCVFLAACSSGDTEEVKRLLDRGADINTANVDGLTALHQACIDDNSDMVEFLVDGYADVDICDNEGWTPLHATASCGFAEIARYLMKHGANIAAVNNDGDLAIDIAEDRGMQKLLREEMDKKGIDAEAARSAEQNRMLADANCSFQSNKFEDVVHPKTGATALHVAAAKGYVNVISVLLQAGAAVNVTDNDGWTPLHAAVHWGQEESCHILMEHMSDMDIKNKAGRSAFDLADRDMAKILEDLKKKQAMMLSSSQASIDVAHTVGHYSKRRSSVTRMSSDQKQSVIMKTSEEERSTLDANLTHLFPKDEESQQVTLLVPIAESETSTSWNETSTSWNETSTSFSQPLDQCRPDATYINTVPGIPDHPVAVHPAPPVAPVVTTDQQIVVSCAAPVMSNAATLAVGAFDSSMMTVSGTLTRSTDDRRLPSSKTSGDDGSTFKPADAHYWDITSSLNDSKVLPWRQNLLKPSSQFRVPDSEHDSLSDNHEPNISTPATHVDAVVENHVQLRNRPVSVTTTTTTTTTPSTITPSSVVCCLAGSIKTCTADAVPGDRATWHAGQTDNPYPPFLSRYGLRNVAPHLQDTNKAGAPQLETRTNPSFDCRRFLRSYSSTVHQHGPTITTASLAVVTEAGSSGSLFRRSYEPPKRDEETETQRKARAKRARQTRRSTQGVILEDIEKAEEVLRKGDSVKHRSAVSAACTRLPDRDMQPVSAVVATSLTTLSAVSPSPFARSAAQLSSAAIVTATSSGVGIPPPVSSKDVTDALLGRLDNRLGTLSSSPPTLLRPSSFRRRREINSDLVDGSSTILSDITSTYVPRSQRHATSIASPDGFGPGLSRASSLRAMRTHNGLANDTPVDQKVNVPVPDKDERKETTAIKARRKRQERRSTGINYLPGDEEKGKETVEDESTDMLMLKSRLGQHTSSDVHTGPDRPDRLAPKTLDPNSSPAEHYKKLYEHEKEENQRVNQELVACQKELLTVKSDLNRAVRHDSCRNSELADKREKRTLERKVSEYEEELKKLDVLKIDNQRLKDENGALIRVISKLSK